MENMVIKFENVGMHYRKTTQKINSLKEYLIKKVKKQVLDVAEKVKKNTDIDRDVLKNSTLEQEIFNLNNGEFKIALIAPFSAGKSTFINSLKVNIGLSLVGVISGEFLVSKAGLRISDSIWRASIPT